MPLSERQSMTGHKRYLKEYLESQVAGNNRPLYSKVDHYWFKVAHNYEPLALVVFWAGVKGAGPVHCMPLGSGIEDSSTTHPSRGYGLTRWGRKT